MSETNISALSTEELQKKLKQLKSEKIINAVILGICVVAFVVITIKGGTSFANIVNVMIIYFFYRNAKNRDMLEKAVVNELATRESR